MLNMYILVRSNVDSWDRWKKMAISVSSVNPLNNALICFILLFLLQKLHAHA